MNISVVARFSSLLKVKAVAKLGGILLLFLQDAVSATTCSNVNVQVLGSGGPELNDGRASSSYLIWHSNKARVLLDIGSGSSVQFDHAGANFNDVEVVLLSHLHSDHSADLPSYFKGGYFTGRENPLWILGPEGNDLMPSTTEFIDRVIGPNGAFPYLSDNLDNKRQDFPVRVDNQSIEAPGKLVKINRDIEVMSLPVIHGPVAAVAWKVKIAGCTITYSGDMNNTNKAFTQFSNNADLIIVHAAIPHGASGIASQLHMTPNGIAEIVQNTKAKRVLLSHFMTRSLSNQQGIAKTVRNVFSGQVIVANDLKVVSL